MGTNNEARPSAAELVAGLLEFAPRLAMEGELDALDVATGTLADVDAGIVRPQVADLLVRIVISLWGAGWQPAEVVRHVRRGCSAPAVGLVRLAIALDDARREPSAVDWRWAQQVDGLDLPRVADDPAAGWIGRWAAEARLDRLAETTVVVELLAGLIPMPVIDELIPPPGGIPSRATTPRARPVTSDPVRDPILEKVRAMLAKAESTTFEAEAEAFTAKAQELMARHAIDAALIDSAAEVGESPTAVRIAVDDPYVEAKSLLLQVVADAVGCRAVFLPRLAMSTVVGFATDLAAVELMYTSLLVQAQTAMVAAARTAPPGTRPRSRGFRSSFLFSFASRIGQRLEEINAFVLAESEAERGIEVLPALLSRDALVDDAVAERFGALQTRRRRGSFDPAGWASGKVAADLAQIAGGPVEGPDGAAR